MEEKQNNFIGGIMEKLKLKDVIKQYQTKNNLNNAQFAVLVGVTGRAIRWYLDELEKPSQRTLKAISKVTGVGIDKIEV